MKSESDVIAEVLGSSAIQKKLKKILEQMDNINPFGLCMFCKSPCGKGHLICLDCYAQEKSKYYY